MTSILLNIVEEEFTKELEEAIFQNLIDHSIEIMGNDGNLSSSAFVARENGEFCGALVVRAFWGALHIRHLAVSPRYRRKGVGRALMEKGIEWGKGMGCHFSYVETLSFQALEFYEKLGYELEFTRLGYDQGISMHYLKKML